MPSSYSNDLRIEEQATGENSATWGTKLNSAISQISDAFSYGTEQLSADANETFTIADGTADAARSLYLKITSAGSLTATRTVTLGPNTVSKIWIIENATTGSQSIEISQGSGSNVSVASGATKVVYTDGAGASAAVTDALVNLALTAPTLTGTAVVASLDISGDIDVDGTTNLDVVDIDGAVDMASTLTLADNATFADNAKAIFGTSGDGLEIYHNGSNSFIDDSGTGNLQIRANAQVKLQKYTGENMFVGIADGAASMYYDNSQKIATTSTGVSVTGVVTSDGLTVTTASSGATPTAGTVATFEGNDNTEISLLGGSSSVLGINFGHSGDNDEGRITFNTTAGSEDLELISSNTITLDAAGDIIFDSDAPNWRFKDAGTSILEIGSVSSGPSFYSAVSDADMLFKGNDGGSPITALTLDMSEGGNATFAGNVGIGGDPSFDFEVNRATASATALISSGNNDAMLRLYTSNNVGKWRLLASNTNQNLSIANLNSGATAFDTRLEIDANGMMGLGTTPENAFVAYKTFEIGRDFAIYGSTSAQHGGSFSNVYLDAPGNYKRKNEGQSTFLNQIGQYEWYTVAYDAADATITWGSAKMTLTNDGKLGIGVAPSRRKLEVSDSSPGIVFRDTGVTGLYHEIVGGGDTGLELWADNGDVSSSTYIRFGVDGEERARIHAGGTLELTVPDSYTTLKLTPTGTNANATLNFNTPGTGDGILQVQGTEAVRIRDDHSVAINDGHVIFSNGYGAHFGAAGSGNAGLTSSVLDAYEEGTWTPQLWGYGSTQLGTSVAQGQYTRIGNMCYAAFRIQVDDLNSVSASYMIVQNLPFAHPNDNYGWAGVVNYFSGLNYDVSGLTWDVSSTTTHVWLTAVIGTDGHGASATSYVGSSYMTSSTMLKGMIVYRVS